ncbi:flavin reductase (DIM6/NTAB) family NADH-FMN oxidoreductase RutF [Erwinia toletana]|uniref:Flavin reductase (DIM6/NTAB) family NADH-FMN oxidoreductase RutF n=1 Tax=Winslowiella toletana TaxID=92490 RepID=A0ABS4PBK8_9GAMM|nr:flavin reductase [Winslowiella toletana]MBP2170029.1 flavin reductase (DIM6/NTAB) family NADH-FMN oxidoreductase RutF [Winslowiella toletana]
MTTGQNTLEDQFRAAMRQLATAVNIITTGQGDERRGLTASAVCSLTVTPPMVLICVNHFGEAHRAILENGAFCVNVLNAEQRFLADIFAGQAGVEPAERFSHASWSELESGAPALDGALVNIDCRIAERVQTSTHSVFFGAVEAIRFGQQHTPLLHFDRHYFSLATASIA